MAKKELRSGAYIQETWSKETPAVVDAGGNETSSRSLSEYSFRSDGYVLSRLVVWMPRTPSPWDKKTHERVDYGWKRGLKLTPEAFAAIVAEKAKVGWVKTYTATQEDAEAAERKAEVNKDIRRRRWGQ